VVRGAVGTDASMGDPGQLPVRWGEYRRHVEVQLNIIAERLLGLPRDP